MDEDAPKLQVRLVGRDGRRRYDPASRDQLVAACLEPGVSVSRLADRSKARPSGWKNTTQTPKIRPRSYKSFNNGLNGQC